MEQTASPCCVGNMSKKFKVWKATERRQPTESRGEEPKRHKGRRESVMERERGTHGVDKSVGANIAELKIT